MALTILEDCINCDACRAECPTESVSAGEDIYQIDPETCVECVGYFDEPKCVELCPIDCIVQWPRKMKSMQRHSPGCW